MSAEEPTDVVAELIARSNRLGADRRNTNYGGGNTSAKAEATDPVTTDAVQVMWVKGSGGDLGTLTPSGLSALRLDRVRALEKLYHRPEQEDEMHQLLDHCLFGTTTAAPSIDTSMHALLDSDHVDHLHPDSVIAIAASADGERLTRECYGEAYAWVPWRRPGFELAQQVERLRAERPELEGVILGGHGLTTWGDTSEQVEQRSLDAIAKATEFIERTGRPEPLGPLRSGFEPLPADERARRAAALGPILRGLASTDARVVGRWFGDDDVVDFVGREAAPRVVPLGTSCPDHFIRTKVRPLLLDRPTTAPFEDQVERLRELHQDYRAEYEAYYRRHTGGDTPAMRGADPAIFLIPGVGLFSFGSDSQTARVAGEFYLNAINVIRGAEAISTYQPVPEDEKFRVEYWLLEELKLRRRPAPAPLAGRVSLVTGAGSGIGQAIAIRLAEAGSVVVAVDRNGEGARATALSIGGPDAALAIQADVTDEDQIRAAFEAAARTYGGVDIVVNNAGLSLSRSLLDTTTADWDLQHEVMARGSFLVARHATETMVAQGTGGDLIYIVSKNAVAAGPNNVAYSSAKASQAHQVRLLAAELGEHGIRVNGINPDGVVRGSGIFAGGWGADRAEVYGVPEEQLGQFYAARTLLKREVLPEHVAEAVRVLVDGSLDQTTGLTIPVDSGVVSAFLR